MDDINFTLILPYYNESKSVNFTLSKLQNLKKPPTEILFINSKSSDDSSKKIDEFIKKNSLKKWKNYNTNLETPSEAKNFGIMNSNYDWCAFMDFDLNFDRYWTEDQIKKIKIHSDKKIFFGQILLSPTFFLDKLIIAQTWGLNRKSLVIPSSFINKEYFSINGLFLPVRSYYDKVFIEKSIKSKEIFINNEVIIQYRSICYAKDLKTFVIKTLNYSSQVIYLKNTLIPYLYFFILIILSTLIFVNKKIFFFLIIIYLFLRSFIIPFKKNRNLLKFIRYRDFIPLFFIGCLYDVTKLIGYILGFVFKIFNKKLRFDYFYK